jgi:hypothetical protein
VVTGVGLVLYVIAGWWGATGLILYLVRRPVATFRRTLALCSVLALAALVLLRWSSTSATISGACAAFATTLVIWGWLEMSFLFGAVTGPRRSACAAGCRGFTRLRHAIEAILYHELATIGAAALVAALTWHAPNQTGLWTFMLLWGMLPPHLQYLGAFFRRRKLNPLVPISMIATTLLSVLLIGAAVSAPAWGFQAAELTLLATLSSLAWLEHWMLILPMRADAPWKFTRAPSPSAAADTSL